MPRAFVVPRAPLCGISVNENSKILTMFLLVAHMNQERVHHFGVPGEPSVRIVDVGIGSEDFAIMVYNPCVDTQDHLVY